MRKANQEIKDKETIESLLKKANICRLGMLDNGLPYVLPFNYGYKDQHIYIHCSIVGKKLEALKNNPTVCFEIEGESNLIKGDKACKWSTSYQSIVGYAKAEILTDFAQKEKGLDIIMAHHGAPEKNKFEAGHVNSVVILKLKIESLTGKQSSNWDRIQASNNLNFESERLLLSEISMDDIEDIHNLQSIPEVDEFNTLGIPKTIADTLEVMQPSLEAQSSSPRSSYTWKLQIKETNEFIGLAGLFLSNDKFKLGEIYYKLDPGFWGKGYATETAKRLIKLGFDHFNLQKVEAGVASENIKSIKVLEKTGMTQEGLRRKILPIRGEWKDGYLYAIVRTDPRDY